MTGEFGDRPRAAEALDRAGIRDAAPEAAQRLDAFIDQVAAWGARIHLVGKGNLQSSIDLLLLDSLLLLRQAEGAGLFGQANPGEARERSCRIADIGSGAGFPGMIWKIVRPDMNVVLFERKLKPQLFLERLVRELFLEGIEVVGDDAKVYRDAGSFRVVTSKAAGRLSAMLPLAERLLAPGGAYITIKGKSWKGELEGAPLGALRFRAAEELPEKRGTTLIFNKI